METGKTRAAIGQYAEQLAEVYLQERGLCLRERNYRCRGGEIDLIMEDQGTLVFVEVRYRKHHSFGGALASVDRRKQQRLRLAAQHYLQRQHRENSACRFDVVAISPDIHNKPLIQWLSNAIESD